MSVRASRAMIVLVAVCATVSIAQVEAREPALDAALAARLEALDPSAPIEYFRLGESLAFDAPDPGGDALAQRLLVLAYELDRREGADELGPSVCLALAEISGSAKDRRWLRALARALTTIEGSETTESAEEIASMSQRFELAEALGLFRAGEYRRALTVIERPAIHRLLEELEDLLPGGVQWILQELHTEPTCRECNNRRIIVADLDQSRPFRLCYTCGGSPGPDLSDESLVAVLRVESFLLEGAHQSWAAQLLADRLAPLPSVDPDHLAARFGVDPEASVYRAGAWVAPELDAPSEQGVR